jgi:hypothetical protein
VTRRSLATSGISEKLIQTRVPWFYLTLLLMIDISALLQERPKGQDLRGKECLHKWASGFSLHTLGHMGDGAYTELRVYRTMNFETSHSIGQAIPKEQQCLCGFRKRFMIQEV